MIIAFSYVIRVRLEFHSIIERKIDRRLLYQMINNYPCILLLAYEGDFSSVKIGDTVNLPQRAFFRKMELEQKRRSRGWWGERGNARPQSHASPMFWSRFEVAEHSF